MLWNASAMTGYAIKASNGEIGTVSDMIFEDADWAIRWLVVDTGEWLPGRKVFLPVSALGTPDPGASHLPVNLTMRQIEESPAVDMSQTVSSGTESLLHDYYGLPRIRNKAGGGVHVAMAAASGAPDVRYLPPVRLPDAADSEAAVREPNLHGLSAITGSTIEATDGDIGHAEDFLIDTASWQVRYMTVHTANWWPGEKVLISPRSVDWIDVARGIIQLDVTRQKVKDSPSYLAAETVDGAFEESFDSYYGIRFIRR